jgi:hypothetical protein
MKTFLLLDRPVRLTKPDFAIALFLLWGLASLLIWLASEWPLWGICAATTLGLLLVLPFLRLAEKPSRLQTFFRV